MQQEYITAVHEAAHGVAAYCVGWYVGSKGIWIDGAIGSTSTTYGDWDRTENAGLIVYLAGWLAERKYCGYPNDRMSQYRSDMAECIDAARDSRSEAAGDAKPVSDARNALGSLLKTRCASITDDELVNAFKRYEEMTARLIETPIVWDAIERVAAALHGKGKLTSAEVESILMVPGRRPLIAVWCKLFDGY